MAPENDGEKPDAAQAGERPDEPIAHPESGASGDASSNGAMPDGISTTVDGTRRGASKDDQAGTAGTDQAAAHGAGELPTDPPAVGADGEPIVADGVALDVGEPDGVDSAGADLPDGESVEELRAKLVVAEDQAAAHWDRLLRLQADMENQRKRAQRELTNARKFALEGMVNDLLPIKDSLEMGIAAAQGEGGSIEKLLEGSELTLKMLAQAFEKHSVVEVNPVDEKFNPDFHEAMSMQDVEGKATNTVTAVLQKGYTLNERLIRPALVMVAR